MLILVFPHSEGCENHHHHEEIVYRQRLLYQITGDIRHGHIMAILLKTRLKIIGVEFQMGSIA